MAATEAPPQPARQRAEPAPVLALIAAGFVGLFLVSALIRARFPYALEWMEGPMAQQVERVRQGRSVFAEPDLGYTALNYPPLYAYLAAPFQALVPQSLTPLRLLSVGATLGSLTLVSWFVVLETGRRAAAVVAAGLLAAAFAATGAFYDLVRVDAVGLALILGGLALARSARTPQGLAGAGVLLAAAVLTKQVALLPALAAAPWAARQGRRAAGAYLGAFGATLGGLGLLFQFTSAGWFGFFVREVASSHPVVTSRILGFWTSSFLPLLAPLAAVAVAAIVHGVRRHDAAMTRFHLPVWTAMLVATYLVGIHDGAYLNTMITAVVPLAVLAGIALARFPRSLLVAGALAVQFTRFAYDPRALIPSDADRRAADAVVATLRTIDSPVLMPADPWYLVRAGRPMNASSVAIADVLGPGREAPVRTLRAQLDQWCRSGGLLVVPEPEARLGELCSGPCLGQAHVVTEFATRYEPPSGARSAPARIVRLGPGC